jgi:hypothetical protein
VREFLPFTWARRWFLTLISLAAFASAASDPRPVVGPGATKDEVINAYGWPNGQSQSGTKEILSYAQGEVVLENGRVERVNFSPTVPWQSPRPRPGPPTASTRKVAEVPIDFWLTSFPSALKEAQRRHSRILVLFTGSDWSPASRKFHDEVELNPDFVNAFAGDFVFVKLDYPRGNPVPVKISEENLTVRDLYNVTTYPSLLILGAEGELLARVDLAKSDPNLSYRDRMIAAVRAARDNAENGSSPAAATSSDSTGDSFPTTPATENTASAAPAASDAAASTAAASATSTATAAPAGVSDGQTATKRGQAITRMIPAAVLNAGNLVIVALLIGGAVVAFLLWRLWRQPQPNPDVPVSDHADRIDAIASGMPTSTELGSWSKDKLCAVVSGLCECDGYLVQRRPGDDDVDLELRRQGDTAPRILVLCVPGTTAVPTRRLRELFGSLAAEGVPTGWVVSPGGFSAESREYGKQHGLVLLDNHGIYSLMREIPPVSLPRVLGRT